MSTQEEYGETVAEFITDETTCRICQAEFLDEDDLQIHIDQFHGEKDIKKSNVKGKLCDFCTYRYTDYLSYAGHLRDAHILLLHYCKFCLRAFNDEKAFKKHEARHKSGSFRTLHSCWKCDKKLTLSEMKDHDFTEHCNDKEGVIIQKVLPYLSSVLKVKAVTFIDSIGVDTVFICVGCNFSTTDIESYLKHTKKLDCTVYTCSKCSNVYRTKMTLSRHLTKECGNTLGQKFKMCTGCEIMIPKKAFADHRKVCTIMKCYTCNKKFVSMYKLTQHQAIAHPLSVELKKCTFCWKQCVGSFTLRKHIEKSHKHEFHLYKYKCIYCNNVYKHPQKLFGHFFGSHKDISPYTCKICDSTKFKLRKKFTIHIKLVHKSEGFVEFDENYHVFFTDKKSENPFIPKSLFVNENDEKNKSNEKQDEKTVEDHLYSDINATETEANQTEVEEKPKLVPRRTTKRKRALKARNTEPEMTFDDQQSSDDEPLLEIKRKVQKSMPRLLKNSRTKTKKKRLIKKSLICEICDKYCYTIQNYEHHVSLHSRTEVKKCIKCHQVFRSNEKLNKHIAAQHSTSKLTETLKTMLEKKKEGKSITDDLPVSEKFRRTIKRSESAEFATPATIKPVDTNLSVQTFIENFTPDVLNETKNKLKVDLDITCSVTIKPVSGLKRKPQIKMTKFTPKPMKVTQKLSMPIKFKDHYKEKTKINVKIVQTNTESYNDYSEMADHNYEDNFTNEDHYYTDRMTQEIPEVAEEIETVGTIEIPKATPQIPIQQKITIPQLPNQLKDIRIAHLLPQAPYYKIVKVDEVLNHEKHDKTAEDASPIGPIELPDGTKLVNANPLAHLLGNTPVNEVLASTRNKYYKVKKKNYQNLLAKALSKLDKPSCLKKPKRKPKIDNLYVNDTKKTVNLKTTGESKAIEMTPIVFEQQKDTDISVNSEENDNAMIEVETLDEELLKEESPPPPKPETVVKKKKKIGPKSKTMTVEKIESLNEENRQKEQFVEETYSVEVGHDMPVIESMD